MKGSETPRRDFIKTGVLAGSAFLVAACGTSNMNTATAKDKPEESKPEGDKKEGIDVTPVEDLMREHGVLRRCLIVFNEAAIMLPTNPPAIYVDALQKTAKLFRAFGEEYHEKRLEEQFIFPLIREKGAGGPAGNYPELLMSQHARGREITDFIISSTAAGKLTADARDIANALSGFTRMYEVHAAHEDTVVFPAWKELMSEDEYDDLGDKFEDIEYEQFGEDGFGEALKQIAEVEAELGINDISKFTPPAPGK